VGVLGPNSGGTAADDATVGTISLTNVTNVLSSNNTYVTAVLLLNQVTHYLTVTNFGFAIPLDATITGILVEIERSATLALSLTDSSVKLVKGGVISGTDKASGANWPNADAYASYGNGADLWGQPWTPADLNLSTFGVAIAAVALAGVTLQIDHVRITITFIGSNRPGSLLSRVKSGDGMSVGEWTS
jgi:hypothetical protein